MAVTVGFVELQQSTATKVLLETVAVDCNIRVLSKVYMGDPTLMMPRVSGCWSSGDTYFLWG